MIFSSDQTFTLYSILAFACKNHRRRQKEREEVREREREWGSQWENEKKRKRDTYEEEAQVVKIAAKIRNEK